MIPSAPARLALSIVVCTFDREPRLLQTLSALNALGYIDRYDVIVVENTDDRRKRRQTAELCRSEFAGLNVLESETVGLAHARNIGLEVESDLIAYLDDDAVPAAGWAEAITKRSPTRPLYMRGTDSPRLGGRAAKLAATGALWRLHDPGT